jgi:hypothetical protein
MGAAVAVPAAMGAASLIGGIMQGRENEANQKYMTNKQIKAQQDQSAMGLYANGPWSATLPYMQSNLTNLVGQYNDPNRQYINTQAGASEGLNQAIAMGLDPTMYNTARFQSQNGLNLINQGGTGLQNYLNSGQQNVTGSNVADYASGLLNSNLINQQMDAYSNDIARNLGENQLTGIRSADIATGNLGSSRGGVQEAIARRGAEDRIAAFRGNLVGNALNEAGSQLQNNVQNTMSGYQNMLNAGNTAQQGAGNLLNLSQDQLTQLYNVGKAQQGVEQANLNNQIGQRDFNLMNQQALAGQLQNYQGVGNLINYGALNPTLANYKAYPDAPTVTPNYLNLNFPRF